MDHGTLTDNNGRKADFRHIIIIMTTNAGASMLEKNPVGFSEQDRTDDSLSAIKMLFSPEFRNRLDAIVPFNHLEKDPQIGRSEALRRSIIDIMNSGGFYSHPLAWAPFIFIGDGSKGI